MTDFKNIYKNVDDDKVVYEASRIRSCEGAPVEMMRRLKNSIEKFDESSQKYSFVLIILTLVLAEIGLLQFFVTIAEPQGIWKLAWYIIPVFFVYIIGREIKEKFFNKEKK